MSQLRKGDPDIDFPYAFEAQSSRVSGIACLAFDNLIFFFSDAAVALAAQVLRFLEVHDCYRVYLHSHVGVIAYKYVGRFHPFCERCLATWRRCRDKSERLTQIKASMLFQLILASDASFEIGVLLSVYAY